MGRNVNIGLLTGQQQLGAIGDRCLAVANRGGCDGGTTISVSNQSIVNLHSFSLQTNTTIPGGAHIKYTIDQDSSISSCIYSFTTFLDVLDSKWRQPESREIP